MASRSRMIKYLIVIITEMEMLFFSGIGFGMNSLFPTLSDMNYFCASQNGSVSCPQQRQYLGYLLLTTIISYSVVAVPIGIFYDQFGNSITKMVSAVTVFVACLSYALSSTFNHYLAFVASIFLGFLAQTMLTCNIGLSDLFPSFQNKIISIYSGSFDSSNIMMTLVTLGYRAGIRTLTSFLTLAITGLLVCSATCVLCRVLEKRQRISDKNVSTASISHHKNDIKLEDKSSDQYLEARVNERYPTLQSALLSRQYLFQVANLTILFFRYAFFLAELNLQLDHLFNKDQSTVNSLLLNSSYIFVGGFLLSPFPGIVVDAFRKRNRKKLRTCDDQYLYGTSLICFTPSFFFCTTMNIIMSILILIPNKAAIYGAYVAFMLMRVTLFSTNSSYLLIGFPKRYFGKLFGIGVLISGALSFVQYALLFNDSMKLSYVNYSLIVIVALTYVHPIMLIYNR